MAAGGRNRGLQLIGLFATISYPVSLHLLIINGQTTAAVWVLLAASGIYFLLAMRGRRSLPARLAGAGVLLAAIISLLLDHAAALFLPPILMSGALLQVFGHSLLPGQEPLIGRFARQLEGVKDARSLYYARGLTWFWTLVSAAILIQSVLLALLAPLEIWSLFTNFLNYVIIAVLFLLEYMYRLLFFRRLPSLRPLLDAIKSDKGGQWNHE